MNRVREIEEQIAALRKERDREIAHEKNGAIREIMHIMHEYGISLDELRPDPSAETHPQTKRRSGRRPEKWSGEKLPGGGEYDGESLDM